MNIDLNNICEILLHPQGFTDTPSTEKITQILSSRNLKECFNRRVRFIKETKGFGLKWLNDLRQDLPQDALVLVP